MVQTRNARPLASPAHRRLSGASASVEPQSSPVYSLDLELSAHRLSPPTSPPVAPSPPHTFTTTQRQLLAIIYAHKTAHYPHTKYGILTGALQGRPVPCSACTASPSVSSGWELPVPLPAPAALLTGGRCCPQRTTWGSSSLPPHNMQGPSPPCKSFCSASAPTCRAHRGRGSRHCIGHQIPGGGSGGREAAALLTVKH